MGEVGLTTWRSVSGRDKVQNQGSVTSMFISGEDLLLPFRWMIIFSHSFLFSLFIIFGFECLHRCMHSEVRRQLQKLVLSFHLMVSRKGTQIFWLTVDTFTSCLSSVLFEKGFSLVIDQYTTDLLKGWTVGMHVISGSMASTCSDWRKGEDKWF